MTRAILIFAAAVSARAAGWVALDPVIVPRQEVAVAAVNGKLYVIGGLSGNTVLSSVEEFDPTTGRWRFVAPLPAPIHHAAAAGIGNSVYVIGGFAGLAFHAQSSVFRYDTTLDQWSEVAPLPKARGALAAAAIDGKIYAVGGLPGGRDLTVYDPETNVWSTLPSMPTAREHLAAVAVGGALYVVGGRFSSLGNSDVLERFDPATGLWTSLPFLPTARSGLAAAVLGGRIYVFGGEGNTASVTGVFPQTESYDVETQTWRSEPRMAVPRHGIGAATIGKLIHIPAGAPIQGFSTTAEHDAFFADGTRRRAVR